MSVVLYWIGMSVIQQVGQAVSTVASDVADTAKSAIGASAKQIAKTPLDILEELLGSGGPGGSDTKKETPSQDSSTPGLTMEEMTAKMQQDDQFREEKHQELHDSIQNQSLQYYQQKKQDDLVKKQQEEEQKKRERFEIKQLEKQKSHDYALQAAQDASNAEKRVGAG